MKTTLFILSILISTPLIMHAQSFNGDSVATVVVHKDPRFSQLAAMQAEINKKSYMTRSHYVRGFRIQVVNTQNRDEANAVKAELLRRFPDQKSYLLYKAPSFRVRIGNFITQKDAFQLRKMIAALYPGKGIYIVADIIEHIPSPDEEYNDEIINPM